MAKKIHDEARSWPELGDAEEALSTLREGLQRIRSKVALAKRALQEERAASHGKAGPTARP